MLLIAIRRQPTVLVLLHLLACGAAEPLLNLHAGNFDRVIEQHDHVVVHFWAPGVLEPLPNDMRHATHLRAYHTLHAQKTRRASSSSPSMRRLQPRRWAPGWSMA